MDWSDCQQKVVPYIFRVETPEGSGTGVFFAYNRRKDIIAIATAAHVVEHADDWKQPIKLRQHSSGKIRLVEDSDRAIFLDRRRDSASIIITNEDFDLPDETLPMIAENKYKRIGTEIAWMGYPSIAYPHLCFFTGRISSFIHGDDSYLIDGVAINGVSGGPVFARLSEGNPQLLGIVSAYMANRVRGDALPGLLRSQDVTTFHETIKTFTSLDEAREKKEKEEAVAKREEQRASEPPAGATPDAQQGAQADCPASGESAA
ncbi:MAG: serine protease [bacterium]